MPNEATRRRAYWICQIAAWGLFGVLNMLLVSQYMPLDLKGRVAVSFCGVWGIGVTHLLRMWVRWRGLAGLPWRWMLLEAVPLVPLGAAASLAELELSVITRRAFAAAALPLLAETQVSLFDGETFAGWKTPKAEVSIGDCWRIRDGAMEAVPGGPRRSDLWSVREFTGFDFRFEFWPAAAANAGVKFQGRDAIYVDNLRGQQKVIPRAADLREGAVLIVYTPAYEYQVAAPDEPDGLKNAASRAGSLYSKVPAPAAVESWSERWNRGRIRLEPSGRLRLWLNDRPTVDFQMALPLPPRPLVLQHHDSVVRFRNLRVEVL
jgi:hypothetical protein